MSTVSDFWRIFLGIFGILIDAWVGPSSTTIYQGEVKHRVIQIRPTSIDHWLDVSVRCCQIIYHTRYRRFWVWDRKHVVYEVSFHAPPNVMAVVDVRLHEKITYPILCNGFLRWTRYPHMYAINAFLDRVSDTTILPSLRKRA